jgi:hypothetical protein
MAKSLEQKLAESVRQHAGHSTFSPIEFARILAQEDLATQQAFYSSMISYITYKGIVAQQYDITERDTIAGVCRYLKECLGDYFPEYKFAEQNRLLL